MVWSSKSSSDSNANENEEDEEEAWDANVDYEKEWPKDQAPPDPSSAWDSLPNMPSSSSSSILGIGISLEPLSQEQAQEIKEEAKEIINSAISSGIEDIEKMRKRMTKDLEESRKIMQVASDLQAQQKSEERMQKIDKLTGTFLESTKETRATTKLAAAASRAMEGKYEGIELGTWGTLGGRTVVASGGGTLLGSVENAKKKQSTAVAGDDEESKSGAPEKAAPTENRIVTIADTKQVRYYCE
jgi:TolA-binding protein